MSLKFIKIKSIIFVSLIITLSFGILGLYNYNISKKMIHDEIIYSSIPLLRDNIYSEIRQNVIPSLKVSEVMSKNSFLINWALNNEENSGNIIQYLDKIKNEFDYFTTFFISNNSKNYFHYNGLHKVVSMTDPHDIWYFNFIKSEKVYNLDVDFDEAGDNELTIFVNYKVNDFEGNLLGVTGVGIKMEGFSNFLNEQQEKYNRTIYLVDQEGIVQAHSNIKEIYGSSNIVEKIIDSQVTQILSSYKKNNQTIIISAKYIEDFDWYLIVEQNESNSLKSANDNLTRTLIAGLILLVTILITVGIILNYFSTKLEILAVTDPLTGCYNRREFNNRLEKSLDKKIRSNSPLSLITIDIDYFKKLNDSFGHHFGDKVLKVFSRMVYDIIRSNDIFCRVGGDEFAILLEADEEETLLLANRIKNNLKNTELNVTISIGVYEALAEDSISKIIKKSDDALYLAKNSGRDCIKTI